jgi:hypothetical protein
MYEPVNSVLQRGRAWTASKTNGRIERDWIHLALVLIVPFAERRRESGRARSFYTRETRAPVDK